MGEPNFGAYQRYLDEQPLGPVAVIDGGKPGKADDYIFVEFDGFRGISQNDSERLVTQFNEAAEGRGYEGLYAAIKGTSFETDINIARDGLPMLVQHGGAYARMDYQIVFSDEKVVSFKNFSGDALQRPYPGITPEHEKLFREHTKEHEAAHLMLDVDEAGADYIASMRLLEKYPGQETKDFLQSYADIRLISPLVQAADKSAENKSDTYGYGCSVAIEAAINAPDSERKLSIQELYENGRSYDAMNGASGNITMQGQSTRPEMSVRKALLEQDSNIGLDAYKPGDLAKAAQGVIDSDKFKEGNVQRYILEEVVDAAKRIDAKIEAEGVKPSAPAPSVSPAMAPGV